MNDYKILIEAWPYFGTMQAECAPRMREFHIKADEFRDAQKAADFILMGVASHDKVWQANIRCITRWPMPVASVE